MEYYEVGPNDQDEDADEQFGTLTFTSPEDSDPPEQDEAASRR